MKDTMLIVEDLKLNRNILNDIFGDRFAIFEVSTGEEGMELLKKHRSEISIIILDLILPQMSGFDFLKMKNEIEDLKNIPVVVITSSSHVQDQIKSFELGAQEFITKPLVREIVETRVSNVVATHQRIRVVEQEVETLKLKSELDEMTGLYNKTSTETIIQNELLESEGRLDVLLVIDVDHFKIVNDTLGHQVGDKVIKIVANIISSLVRRTDIVGRIGGDEFCVLMKNIPSMEVVYAKLRELCQIMKYKPNLAIPEYITLSIGVASNENKSTTYASLFSKADEGLYEAKQAGKAQYREYGVAPKETFHEQIIAAPNEDEKSNKENLILIVDDEPITRKLFCNILEHKYEILEAENGVEAMKLVNANKDSLMLVILDLFMPLMNGYQVLESMKRSTELKSIPIIISTSDDSEESDLKILNLGANLIVHKPFNTNLLMRQIDNQVDNYKERKKEIKQFMLQKSLIGTRANTFLCTYHFDTKKAEIGENYLKYVSSDFPDIFASYPFKVAGFVLPGDMEQTEEFFDLENNKKQHEEMEVRFRVGNAQYEWFEINKMVNFDENQNIESVIFMFLNIEYAVEAKHNLVFMANNDVLTHIPNVRSFSEDVSNLLQYYAQDNFIMITMDIFQFHVVNQLFGHKEGDNIIKYVANRVQEIVEDMEIGAYCRASSDIFYICLSETHDIGEFMQYMQQAMSKYPLKYQIKLCFGIYKITDRSESIEQMIEHSTFARKKTKEAPIKTFQYYDGEMKKKEIFETVAIAEMEDALETKQFEVYYQPKCDIETGKIVGAEALIRWNHPEEGYLSPAYFIPIFERNGTCVELDYYVYDQVCKSIRNCIDNNKPVVPVSVNLSRWSLYNEDLEKNICFIVDKYQIPHEYIEFEITESAFVLEVDLLISFSRSMREKGFHILIDDFGSGYSSLNSLKDISVDVLKIDIKFLPVSKKEEKAEIVLSAVINMGKSLGLSVIAEGVETEEQVELLKNLGCKCVQGYYFYRPMPYKEFEKVLTDN